MVPQEPWCVAQLDDTGRGMSGNILTANGDCGKQQRANVIKEMYLPVTNTFAHCALSTELKSVY